MLYSPTTIWKAPSEVMISGKGLDDIPGSWLLMLLGDGSPTRHLKLLTGYEVEVDVIGMQNDKILNSEVPLEVGSLKPPLLRRQVWLSCNSHTLAWAESWWNVEEAAEHLHKKEQPIWKSLTQDRSELFREVDGLALVKADWLETKFEEEGPFWSRHYRFFRNEKTLTVIREVFSPELELLLGPVPRQNWKAFEKINSKDH